MFSTVKEKVDGLLREGYQTRWENAQVVWERLRARENVVFKLVKDGKVAKQFLASPDKVGVLFREIPAGDDYCRFHEEPIV